MIEEDITTPAAEKKQIKGVLKKSKYSSNTADVIVNEEDEEDGGSSQQSSIQLSGVYSTTSTNDGESTSAFSNAGSSYSSAMYDGPYSMASTQKVANIIEIYEKNVGAVEKETTSELEAKNQANKGILELQEEENNNNIDANPPRTSNQNHLIYFLKSVVFFCVIF